MDINGEKMESKYWTNNLIIREMTIWNRYPSDIAKVTGKIPNVLSEYPNTRHLQRMRGLDIGDKGTVFLPSVNRYQGHDQCQLPKKEYFWKGNFNYDGDDDDDDVVGNYDDDSVDSDTFKFEQRFHLPQLQRTSSKNTMRGDDFLDMPTMMHKDKFMVAINAGNKAGNYYNYDEKHLQTLQNDNELNSCNGYRSERYQNYKNGFCRQYALNSDDEILAKHDENNYKQVFLKPTKHDESNYTHKKNHNRTKARKDKNIWGKNTTKTNQSSDECTDGENDEKDDESCTSGSWAVSDERGNTKTADVHDGEKGLKTYIESKDHTGTKSQNHKSPLVTRKNNIRKQRKVAPNKKMEEEPVARNIVDNKGVYQNTQKRILKWMSHNYGRIIDVFKKFDVDNSGSLSMEEFYQGMKELGAPGTQVELYMMAKALDRDGDETIDYNEFRKIRSLYKKSAGKRARASHAHEIEDYRLPRLQPCSKCCIGITEPARQYKEQRHISVRMSSISQDISRKSSIEQFVFDVSPEMTVYGIQRRTKEELGGSATNVRIFRRRDKKNIEILEQNKNLGDYGYEGNISSDNPEVVMLYYDYTYPGLDCPLVSASLTR